MQSAVSPSKVADSFCFSWDAPDFGIEKSQVSGAVLVLGKLDHPNPSPSLAHPSQVCQAALNLKFKTSSRETSPPGCRKSPLCRGGHYCPMLPPTVHLSRRCTEHPQSLAKHLTHRGTLERRIHQTSRDPRCYELGYVPQKMLKS